MRPSPTTIYWIKQMAHAYRASNQKGCCKAS